jgi:hypothetical protein
MAFGVGEWIVIGLLLLAATVVASAMRRMWRPRVPASPYRRKASLFSRDERRFYEALVQATGGRFVVFAQMRLIDLVEVPRGVPGCPYWFGKVRHKHVDFVLCDPATAAPVLAIELDGASHESNVQRQRDAEKDAVLRQAGLPLLRVGTQKGGYTAKGLAAAIRATVAA